MRSKGRIILWRVRPRGPCRHQICDIDPRVGASCLTQDLRGGSDRFPGSPSGFAQDPLSLDDCTGLGVQPADLVAQFRDTVAVEALLATANGAIGVAMLFVQLYR